MPSLNITNKWRQCFRCASTQVAHVLADFKHARINWRLSSALCFLR